MKNIVASLAAIVFLVCISNANATTRNMQYTQENQTNFGHVGVSGGDQTGNPGFLALSAPDLHGVLYTYYIWVNGDGDACLASYPTISAYSSFPSGNWNNREPGMGCIIIGTQS